MEMSKDCFSLAEFKKKDSHDALKIFLCSCEKLQLGHSTSIQCVAISERSLQCKTTET